MKVIILIPAILVLSFCSCEKSPTVLPQSLHNEMEANKEFEGNYAEPKDYDSLCRIEYKQGLVYPSKQPVRTILHAALGRKWKLNQDETKSLVTMLNDSANYEWGELGTPETHYYFTFHNDEGLCIAYTSVDPEGMMYSYPSLARMKWGAFRDMEKINRIIEAIKK